MQQPIGGYRIAIDPLLLAAAVPAEANDQVADLGAGTGAVGLCLLARLESATLLAVEQEGDLCSLTAHNAAVNGYAARLHVIRANVTALPLADGAVQHVAMNPPYLSAGTASRPKGRLRDVAAIEGQARLEHWIAAAWRITAPGGTITLIHRADRLDEILALMRRHQQGGLSVLPIYPRLDQPANRVIVQARKAHKTPFRLGRGFVLHQAEGGFTDQALEILQRAGPLTW